MYSLTPYPITPIGGFLGVALALLPLSSQVRKLSLGVWGYAIWIAVYNFQLFVDTIVWHDNVNVVMPAWCDIVTKLQVGAQIGTRASILVICVHLYKITRLRGPSVSNKVKRSRVVLYELLLIIGLPLLVMALFIIAQPFRFEILEEMGCVYTQYSYVGYILVFGPELVTSTCCAILAPLTLRTFLRHRNEMDVGPTSTQGMTYNKYYRLMLIACLDTVFNLPVLIVILVVEIVEGRDNGLNFPYVSWKNVHDGAGGNAPGLSLSSILQTPASEWSADRWSVFTLKWDEWLYVLHAIMFFAVFGTTPEMRQCYRSALKLIPKHLGYKRKHASQVATVSDVAFNSASDRDEECTEISSDQRRRRSLTYLETIVDLEKTTTSEIFERPSDFGSKVVRDDDQKDTSY